MKPLEAVDTNIQQNQKKEPKENSITLSSLNANQKPSSFFRFWLNVTLVTLLILAFSVIIKTVFSEKIGYLIAIILLMSWVLFQYFQIQKIVRWSKNPKIKNGLGNFGAYNPIYDAIIRLIRASDKQKHLLNKTLVGFKRSTEAMSDGVVIIDKSDQIVFATPNAERYLKIKSDIDMGKNIINVIRNPEFADFLIKKDWSKSVFLEDLPVENRVIEVKILPYDDDDRLLICKDITKLKRLESSKKDFVANVSHELKTPLTILGGYIETMIEIPLDKTKKKTMLLEMSYQTLRMERLVNDLLMLSKLDTEDSSAEYKEILLGDLFDKVLKNAHQISQNRHKISIKNNTNHNLLGNYDQIFSAFWNLINNAIIYTKPNGIIRISWNVDNNKKGVFEVSDTGPGIESHHLPLIVKRFYRVDKSRSRESGGTGLGLSIVKNIALKHESKLEIESKIGKGSTFKIIFPSERIKKVTELHEKSSI